MNNNLFNIQFGLPYFYVIYPPSFDTANSFQSHLFRIKSFLILFTILIVAPYIQRVINSVVQLHQYRRSTNTLNNKSKSTTTHAIVAMHQLLFYSVLKTSI